MRLILTLGILLVVVLGTAACVAAQEWRAGAAAVNVSPRPQDLQGALYLGGYGGYQERGAALGIHQPVYARAVALTDGRERLLLLTLDAVGLDNRLLGRIREGASTATGWSEDRIWIAATHTHSAPDLQGLWGGTPDAYRAYVAVRATQAARDAVERLEPVQMAAVTVRAPGLGLNRRGWAFTDESLSLLVARRPQGDLVSVLVNVGIHPTVLGPENRLISPDWVGSMIAALEEWHGGTALFINGVQGDVVPAGASPGFAGASEFGLRVALHADYALRQLPLPDGRSRSTGPGSEVPWALLEPELRVSVGEVTLPLQNEAFVQAVQAGILRYDVEVVGSELSITTRVGHAVLGRAPRQAQMLTVPGEAVTRFGIQLRGLMQSHHGFVLGLTQDSLGYFIPWDEWRTGRNDGYEESVSLGLTPAVLLHQALSSLP